MPVLFLYLVKLTISLSIVYLFYQLVLRRLTFYNSNRWYFIGYTLLSFVIPFINITPVLENNSFHQNDIVQMIPAVERYAFPMQNEARYSFFTSFADWNKWDWISFAVLSGATLLLLRFIIRCISFLQMRSKAQLLLVDGMKLYQVNENIIPFSFGNAVYINNNLHSEEELREIIRHEFVHVKQRHTLDILWSEWLCIINWYNPFAWMLKRSIRQNLEFIADNNVLQNGVDRKQYQYLLLKVIGNNHFSIAPKFNFSSLKKRIVMMNKLQSAKLHLVRFLFILPLLAVILISFRQTKRDPSTATGIYEMNISATTDTVPVVTEPNEKGYIINVKDYNSNCTIVIMDRNGKEVESLLLTKWNENEKYYEEKYGEIPPPPPVDPKYLEGTVSMEVFLERNTDVKNAGWVFHHDNTIAILNITKKDGSIERYSLDNLAEKEKFEKKYGKFPYPELPPIPPASPTPPVGLSPAKIPEGVKNIDRDADKVEIWLKNGKKESFDLTIPAQKKEFEKKYGALGEPPIPPTPPAAPNAPVKVVGLEGTDNLTSLADAFEITDKKAIIHLKNGVVDEYDLTDKDSRRKFERKFGKIINVNVNADVSTNVESNVSTQVNAANKVSINSHINTNDNIYTEVSPVAIISHKPGVSVISTVSPAVAAGETVQAIDPNGHTITGEEEILVTITRKTTANQLEAFKKQMKEKGIDLIFNDMDFDKGKLVKISGTMSSKDRKSKSTFSVTDFHKVILASIKDGSKTYFKVNVTDNNTVI